VTEPTTTITDYILAVECLILGVLLLRDNWMWGTAFFGLAIAAAAGGSYHGFIGSMNPVPAQIVWKVTLYSIGIATLFLLAATVCSYFANPWKYLLLGITMVQFVVYVYFISRHNDFRFVIYNYVPAMVAMILMALLHRNLWLVGAVLISFAGAAIQRSGIQLHRNFNFNDMYHIVQMVGMYFFYRGGKLLQPC
jgi:hypothetical protein